MSFDVMIFCHAFGDGAPATHILGFLKANGCGDIQARQLGLNERRRFAIVNCKTPDQVARVFAATKGRFFRRASDGYVAPMRTRIWSKFNGRKVVTDLTGNNGVPPIKERHK